LEAEAHSAVERAETGHGLNGRMTESHLGRLGVFSVCGSPQVVRRTCRSITAAPADPYKICIQLTGSAIIHQDGREVFLGPGQLALYDTGRPYDLRLSGEWACAVVTIPREALRVSDRALHEAMRHPFSVHTGPGALLANLTQYALAHVGADEHDLCQAHLGEAGIEMVAGMLDASVHEDLEVGAAGDRAAILGYVRRHLREPDLTHASVAAAHHMSSRTLNRLFEGQERTVSEAIRCLRLEAVRSELEDPRWRKSPVMAVAARWGFRDQGHFTRAFKKRFGDAPATYRRLCLAAYA